VDVEGQELRIAFGPEAGGWEWVRMAWPFFVLIVLVWAVLVWTVLIVAVAIAIAVAVVVVVVVVEKQLVPPESCLNVLEDFESFVALIVVLE